MSSISPLTQNDLASVGLLQPEGWGDIMPHIEFYLRSSFCYPIKITTDNKLSGIGAAIVLGDTAWLAHIIVHPEKRNKGLGRIITNALLDSVGSCSTVFLIATKLGEPLYQKVGFEIEMEYIFLKELNFTLPVETITTRFNKKYEHDLMALDAKVSGEDRRTIIMPHIEHAHLTVENGIVTGYYLPSLGEGLIVASTENAGLTLLSKRLILERRVVLPAAQEEVITFLKNHGAKEFLRGTRMRIGKKRPWLANKIFSRIGGNLG